MSVTRRERTNQTPLLLLVCLLITGCIVTAGYTRTAPGPTIVQTGTGTVSGIRQDGIRVYHGIPFAASPVGDPRWRPPTPVQPWDGVKPVKEYSATCPRAKPPTPLPGSPALNMSEDCLYLNVWTPARHDTFTISSS